MIGEFHIIRDAVCYMTDAEPVSEVLVHKWAGRR